MSNQVNIEEGANVNLVKELERKRAVAKAAVTTIQEGIAEARAELERLGGLQALCFAAEGEAMESAEFPGEAVNMSGLTEEEIDDALSVIHFNLRRVMEVREELHDIDMRSLEVYDRLQQLILQRRESRLLASRIGNRLFNLLNPLPM